MHGRGAAHERAVTGRCQGRAARCEQSEGGGRLPLPPGAAAVYAGVLRVLDEGLLAVGTVRVGGRARSHAVQGEVPAGVVVQGQQQREAAEEEPAPRAEQLVASSCQQREHPSSIPRSTKFLIVLFVHRAGGFASQPVFRAGLPLDSREERSRGTLAAASGAEQDRQKTLLPLPSVRPLDTLAWGSGKTIHSTARYS